MCNIYVYRTEEKNFEKLTGTSIFLFTVAFHSTCYECKIVNITGWHFLAAFRHSSSYQHKIFPLTLSLTEIIT